ncbi:MAG: tetratricopeptide repeat protein, partial [bacterium]
MPFFELKDSFSLKSQQYLLKTTADLENQTIDFIYFRHGEVIFSDMRSFDRSLNEQQIKRLASNYHNHFKTEIAKLFQLIQNLRQHKLNDQALDFLALQFMKYGMNLEAIAFVTPFLNKNGAFSHVRFTLGKAYLAVENFETAREQFQHILSTQDSFADAHFYLGLCEYNREDCIAAFSAFTK